MELVAAVMDPSQSYCELGTHIPTAGQPTAVPVHSRDAFGNRLAAAARADVLGTLVVRLQDEHGELTSGTIAWQDDVAGFVATYSASAVGRYRIEVLMGAAHVCDGFVDVQAGAPPPRTRS